MGGLERPPISCSTLALEPAKNGEDLVQELGDALERAAVVEQTSDCTQQVPEQIAGTLLSSDVEHDLIQVHDQTEQVEVERSTTAVQALDRLHDILRQLARRPFPDGRHLDEAGQVRLTVRTMSWEAYVISPSTRSA